MCGVSASKIAIELCAHMLELVLLSSWQKTTSSQTLQLQFARFYLLSPNDSINFILLRRGIFAKRTLSFMANWYVMLCSKWQLDG